MFLQLHHQIPNDTSINSILIDIMIIVKNIFSGKYNYISAIVVVVILEDVTSKGAKQTGICQSDSQIICPGAEGPKGEKGHYLFYLIYEG